MGSDSDWPVMSAAGLALREFDVPFEADVVSAHRMPDAMIRLRSDRAYPWTRGDHCGGGWRRASARACWPRSRRCRSSECRYR